MAVVITKSETVQRLFVTGDPTAAGSIPGAVRPGDTVYREDGAITYRMTDGGLVTESGGTRGQALAASRGGW